MAIRVELELVDGSFTTRMLHAGETVRQFQRNVGQGMTSVRQLNESSRDFLGTLRDVTVVAGLFGAAINNVQGLMTGWAGQIVQVNAEMERMKTLLAGMSQAADPIRDATRQIEYLRESAKNAPYSLAALTNVFVKMKTTGIDPMAGSMKALVDSVAAAGGTEDQLNRASLAISQMAGKGVIQMEELRQQLGEAVPRATELLARALGTTYAQLAQDIATGTVQAKPALEALRLELDRTFGGAAEAQMNTFNGLLNRTRTGLQDFAIKVGQTGYFDAIKKQLEDFNRVLSTPQASAFAQSVGNGLTAAIGYVRMAVNAIIEYKDELILAGQVMAVAFGGRLAMAGLQGMISMVGQLTTSMRLASLQVQAFQTGFMAWAGRNAVGAHGPMQPWIMGSTALATTLRSATTAVGLLSVSLSTIAPWLPLVAGAVLLTGNALGLFSDKTRDAWENLEKYGASSRKAVQDAQPFLEQQREKLRLLEADLAYQQKMVGKDRAGKSAIFGIGDSLVDQIANERKKLDEMERQFADFGAKAEEAEGRKQTEAIEAEIQKRQASIQKSYDQEFVAFSKQYESKRNAAIKAGQSIVDLEEEYRNDTRSRQLRFYEDSIRELESYWEAQVQAASGAMGEISAAEKAAMTATQEIITRRIAQMRQSADALRALEKGTPMSAKAQDEEKLYQKAATALNRMKAELAGNRAELAGASSEAEKLRFELMEMQKYGPLDNRKIAETVEQLLEVQEQIDATKKALDGRTDFERDAANLKRKLQNDIFEAQNRGSSEVDKLILKYKGMLESDFGSTPMQRTITGVKTAFTQTTTEAGRAGAAIRDVFGGTVLSSAQTFLGVVQQIGQAFGLVADNAANVSIDANGKIQMGSGTPYSGQVGAGEIDRVVRTVLAEARNQGDVGMQAVAEVIRNRANSSGKSLDGVVQAPWQFEPWNTAEGRARMAAINPLSDEYKRALDIVNGVLAGTIQDVTNGATHFLNKATSLSRGDRAMQPGGWGHTPGKQIGAHTFINLGYGGGGRDGRSPVRPAIPAQPSTDPNDAKRDTPAGPGWAQDKIEDLKGLQAELNKILGKNALSDEMERVKREIVEATQQSEGLDKNYTAIVKSIKEGKIIAGNVDPNSAQYKELIALAKEWDEADKKARKNKEFRDQLERSSTGSKARMEDLELREAELRRREKAGGGFEYSDSYYRERASRERENDLINKGLNSGAFNEAQQAQARQVLEDNARYISSLRDREMREFLMTENEKVEAVRRGLLTTEQAREQTHQAELRRLEALLQMEGLTAERRAQIEQTLQAKKQAYAQQVSASGPLAKQMQEWGNFGKNMEQAMTGWMDGAADALAQFITTGKADFASLAKSIIADMTKIALKAAFSGMFGGSKGSGGKMGGAVPGAGAAGGKSIMKLFGLHTGGIAGSEHTFTRNVGVDLSALPKFHTGGIIGSDEVPAVLKKGEGVFTPEQMKALGGGVGGNQVQQNINVNVSGGSSGNQKQDEKLADMIGKKVQEAAKAMVGQEIRQQMRPGGMLRR
jgi:tape measure domain-containing protein